MTKNKLAFSGRTRRAFLRSLMLGPLVLSCACNAGQGQPTNEAPLSTRRPPLPTLITLTPSQAALPEATHVPEQPSAQSMDTGWQADGEDLELRHMQIERADGLLAPLVIVRLLPQSFSIDVAYTPDKPRLLRNWMLNTQVSIALNGGYFLEDYQPAGLIISNGQAFGQSYEGFGGMLARTADGSISLRALRDQPYDPNEAIEQAIQSFPMLVFPGAMPADFEDNGQKARRTALAFDQHGRMLLIIAPGSDLSLRELANWLLASDLEIERALNLDGGQSTGLFLSSGQLQEQIDSLAILPIVLLMTRR